MRFDTRILLGVCAAQLAVVGTAEADMGQAVLTGIVKNAKTGVPAEGVVVVVTSNALQGEQTVQTDRTGHYRIPSLPPGTYQLQVLGNGYQSFRQTDIPLRSNSTIRFDPLIVPEGEVMTRTVEIKAPTVDVGASSTGTSIDSQFTKRIPVTAPGTNGAVSRSFENVAAAAPGASADQFGVSLSGTTSPENQYVVDGVPTGSTAYGTNSMALSTEFVSEVQVITGGYMPEYGRASGGVITAVTESGSNEFHGSVWAYYSPGFLASEARKVPDQKSASITEVDLVGIGDVGVDIGGPIIKDKLWFYAGFQAARSIYTSTTNLHRTLTDEDGRPKKIPLPLDPDGLQNDREIIPGTTQTFSSDGTYLQSIAKLNYRASENHRFSLGGIYAPYFSGGPNKFGTDSGGSPEGAAYSYSGEFANVSHRFKGNSSSVSFKWNATSPGKAWNFDTTLGYSGSRRTATASDGTSYDSPTGIGSQPTSVWRKYNPNYRSINEVTQVDPAVTEACKPVPITGELTEDDPTDGMTVVCPNSWWQGAGAGYLYDTKGRAYYGSHTVTYVLNALGHHVIKFGVDGGFNQYNRNHGYSGGRRYYESRDGESWYVNRLWGYLQGPDDPVLLPSRHNTTGSLTGGAFIQDSWSIADRFTLNFGARYDAQTVFKHASLPFISLPVQVAPRAGFIYDFTQKGKSKVFANYARFFATIPLQIADRAGSGEPSLYADYDCENPIEDEAECLDNLVDIGNATNPSINYEMSGGGSTPVDPDLKPPSSDEIVVGGEYEIFPEIRAGVTYTKRWVNRIIEDMSRDEAVTYFVGNPGEGIARDFPKAVRNYDAVNVYLQKNFSKHWLLTANYTASWLKGNVAGLYRPSTGQLDPFMNSDFDLISLLPNRVGWLSADSRHAIKVYAAGDILLPGSSFIAVGGGANARSGRPTSYLGGHERYGDNEVFILQRGTGKRTPWRFGLDMNLGYGYQFSDNVRITAKVDVFNVLNLRRVTGIDNTWTYDAVLPIEGVAGDGTIAPPELEGLCIIGTTDDNGQCAEEDQAAKNPNFGKANFYQTPRQFRFGLRFEF